VDAGFCQLSGEIDGGHARVDEAVAVVVQWLPKRIYKCRCDIDDSRNGLKTDKAHCLTLDRFSLRRTSFADK
jgi:hypothetical protein